jgi:hypothetical protein
MNGMSEGPDVSMLIGVTVHIKVVYLGGYGWQPGKSGPSFTSRPKHWQKQVKFGCPLHVKCQIAIGHPKGDARFSRPQRAWGMWGGLNEDREYDVCIVMEWKLL